MIERLWKTFREVHHGGEVDGVSINHKLDEKQYATQKLLSPKHDMAQVVGSTNQCYLLFLLAEFVTMMTSK